MTVEYLPIANGVGANVETQAQFAIDLGVGGSLVNGYVAGTAQSVQMNKVARQASVMTAAIANFIANISSVNVLDDGNVSALTTLLTNAMITAGSTGAWSTGDVKLTMKVAADAGWVLCNDGTIGDASSGATTRADADTSALFTLLWTNVSDTYAPVVGGRGASAAADFAAHKKITLTKMMGRALAIAGSGAGLSGRALGQNLGEETHILLIAEMASHVHSASSSSSFTGSALAAHGHSISDPGHLHSGPNLADAAGSIDGGAIMGGAVGNTSSAGTGISIVTNSAGTPAGSVSTTTTTGNIGSDTAHNNMQPTTFLNAMIKL